MNHISIYIYTTWFFFLIYGSGLIENHVHVLKIDPKLLKYQLYISEAFDYGMSIRIQWRKWHIYKNKLSISRGCSSKQFLLLNSNFDTAELMLSILISSLGKQQYELRMRYTTIINHNYMYAIFPANPSTCVL